MSGQMADCPHRRLRPARLKVDGFDPRQRSGQRWPHAPGVARLSRPGVAQESPKSGVQEMGTVAPLFKHGNSGTFSGDSAIDLHLA